MALHEQLVVGQLTLTDRIHHDKTYTVANPPANPKLGDVAFFTNGVAGNPGLAFYNGTQWRRVDTPAFPIAAE